jgi:decaprenyl-phosphate phosphoribosyltransferase
LELAAREFAREKRLTPFGIARALVIGMRPRQWPKNLVVFAAPAFALQLDLRTLSLATLAFLTFTAMSASTYLMNDLLDAPRDRLHPAKRSRPIAAGALPVPVAIAAAVILAVAALGSSLALAPGLALAIGIYAVLQIAYNWRLNREPMLDVLCISSGFVARALGGAAAVSVRVSTWFLLCIALLALFLAIEKRRAEVQRVGGGIATRAVLKHYSISLLTRMEAVVTASALMTYSLWAAQRTPKHWMLATVPIVAYVMFRYQMLTEEGAGEDPENVLIKSPAIVVATVLWIATCFAILLLQGHGAPWNVCGAGC